MEKRDLILLPSHNQCLDLMEAHGMLPNIREHSFRVMQVADFLGEALAEAGFDLSSAPDRRWAPSSTTWARPPAWAP